jgi:hypothetical protein
MRKENRTSNSETLNLLTEKKLPFATSTKTGSDLREKKRTMLKLEHPPVTHYDMELLSRFICARSGLYDAAFWAVGDPASIGQLAWNNAKLTETGKVQSFHVWTPTRHLLHLKVPNAPRFWSLACLTCRLPANAYEAPNTPNIHHDDGSLLRLSAGGHREPLRHVISTF